MRVRSPRLLATFLALFLAGRGLASALAADPPELKGDWTVLQVAPFGEREFLTVGFEPHGAKLDASIKIPARLPAPPEVKKVEWADGKLSIDFTIGGGVATLKAIAGKDDSLLGTLNLQGQLVPIRLVKAGAKAAAQEPNASAIRGYLAARGENHPKAKAEKLGELADKEAPSLQWALVYSDLLRAAGPAGLGEAAVRGYVDKWVGAAKAHGAAFAASVQVRAAKTLSGQKPYAAIVLALAQDAEKEAGAEAPTELKAEITRAVAGAATLLGKADVAAAAEAKFREHDAALDAEYRKNVPPFKPAARAPRKGNGDAVVLLELFTGAECPPCVAADVGFDALETSYAPTEVVALQYHLHIPGPDPLTNADSVARAEYYPQIRGTPSTMFNGSPESGGGGDMGMAEEKYGQYRELIEGRLGQDRKADIDLRVDRKGDDVKITAVARAKAKDGKGDGSKLKLRLALVEEQVKYAGGNKLRFHHHVVRAMPGGVDGKAVTDGEVKVEQTVNLSGVRKTLESYLADFAKEHGAFPNPLPAIDLAQLSVVAFVQDDEDKSVLHAVQAPVGDVK